MSEVFPSISGMIPQLRLGDQTAWDSLCEKFRAGLIAKTRVFLRSAKLEKRCSADDLVQETLLKAWTQHESFKGRTTAQFAKWLLVILKHTYIDLARRNDFEASIVPGTEASDSRSPIKDMLELEKEAVLHACLAELDTRSREILVMRHFDGLKLACVAERTGLKVSTIASICRRALMQLAERMKFYEESRVDFLQQSD